MILRVISYDSEKGGHICEDVEGSIWPHAVDLKIDGNLKDVPDSALIGKLIEVDRLQPYVSIGVGCRCVGEPIWSKVKVN